MAPHCAANMHGFIYMRCSTGACKMDRVLEHSTRLKTRQLDLSRESVTESLCLLDRCQKQELASRGHFASEHKGRSQKFIDMMYYAPRPNDYLINRLVASATAKTEIVDTGEEKTVNFSHVEISFPCDDTDQYFDNDKTMGFSIVQNSTVYFRLKSWREEYTAIRMYVDSMVYAKLYQTCVLLSLQNIKFDSFAMYSAILLPADVLKRRTREHHGTYCSKIITEVLQQFAIGGPIFATAVACQSTPSLLYMFLGGRTYATRARARIAGA